MPRSSAVLTSIEAFGAGIETVRRSRGSRVVRVIGAQARNNGSAGSSLNTVPVHALHERANPLSKARCSTLAPRLDYLCGLRCSESANDQRSSLTVSPWRAAEVLAQEV